MFVRKLRSRTRAITIVHGKRSSRARSPTAAKAIMFKATIAIPFRIFIARRSKRNAQKLRSQAMLDEQSLERILSQLPRLTIGVLGDLFLDRYLDIDASLTESS